MVHGHGTGIRTYVCAGPLLSPYGLGKTLGLHPQA